MPPDRPAQDGEQEDLILEGPDFHRWPSELAEMWGLLENIEALDRVTRAMDGPVAQDPACQAARGFLRQAGESLRGQLAAMILSTYQVPLPGEGSSPFEGAGRPRAYGADPPSPPATV